MKLALNIPSDTAVIGKIRRRVLSYLEQWRFSQREIFAARLCLEEALAGAIRHGNRGDPDKAVRVECTIEENRVRIEVEDEGPGFRPEDVSDPTDDENLDRPSGRGLQLMKVMASRVEYNETGSKVVIEIDRPQKTWPIYQGVRIDLEPDRIEV